MHDIHSCVCSNYDTIRLDVSAYNPFGHRMFFALYTNTRYCCVCEFPRRSAVSDILTQVHPTISQFKSQRSPFPTYSGV